MVDYKRPSEDWDKREKILGEVYNVMGDLVIVLTGNFQSTMQKVAPAMGSVVKSMAYVDSDFKKMHDCWDEVGSSFGALSDPSSKEKKERQLLDKNKIYKNAKELV